MYLGASLACEAALGTLRPEDIEPAIRALTAAQMPDGGMAPWPQASESNAEPTLFLLCGLRAAEVSPEDEGARKAAARLHAHGGPPAAGPLALTIAGLVGVVPPFAMPRVPSAIALVPGHDALVARLFGVNALLPLRTLPFLWEAVRAGAFPPGGILSRAPVRPRGLRAITARRLDRYLRDRQNRSGGIAGVPIFTLLGLLCLAASGVRRDDPAMARGLAYVRRVYNHDPDGLMVEPFESTYWDTAHMVRALAAAGDERSLDASRRGAAFLVRGQSTEPSPPDWQTPPPGAPTSGGWSWQPGNEQNPDFDTTAEVLSALGGLARASQSDAVALATSLTRGVQWLRAFQNPDGGWAAFSHRKPRPPPGALYLRSGGPWRRLTSWLAENGDPSTADIVGRVLCGLAAAQPGLGADNPAVAAATRFLAEHQVADGGWWGRWAVNYLAATAYVCSGLARAGVDPRLGWMTRALDWMIGRQNEDGGWGEGADSYARPDRAGMGPSAVALTGLVLWALQVCGRGDSAAVERGLAWLLERQRDDGSFSDTAPFSTMFPTRAYWLNDGYPTFFALEALLERRHHGV